MSLRIGSGWCRGMTLKSPSGLTTRPTGARVREAVLNMLQPYLQDAWVLDLFAGSGAVGIEAVSRGARGAVAVESGRAALGPLGENFAEVKRRAERGGERLDRLEIVGLDLAQAWSRLAAFGPFDVVWADPPYRDVPTWVAAFRAELPRLVRGGAIFGLESDEAGARAAREGFGGESSWQLLKEKKYGSTFITMFQWQPDPQPNGEADDEHG